MPTSRSYAALVAELTKWKLSLAVAFSAMTGYIVFAGAADGSLLVVAMGVFLLSAGAAALNQYTERESDRLMPRTAGRPLPSGKMAPAQALVIAIGLLAAGGLVLLFGGLLPLMLGLLNVLLYNVVYTGLKKVTSLAIIPGALVGAVPPLIGYTAAGGSVTDTVIVLFALFMFLWQMPHFWLLLVRYGSEYEQAGIRTIYGSMSTDKINRLVLLWITGSSLLLWILTGILMPFEPAVAGLMLVLNIVFIVAFRRVIKISDAESKPGNAFILINSFSLLIMVILMAVS